MSELQHILLLNFVDFTECFVFVAKFFTFFLFQGRVSSNMKLLNGYFSYELDVNESEDDDEEDDEEGDDDENSDVWLENLF